MLVHLGVLLTSFVVLGFELALMRTLSIRHWHHFAAMIISVALLGFGASGTFLTIFRRWALRRPREWMASLALALAVLLPICFHGAQKVPFNPLELGWGGAEYLDLLKTCLWVLVPFFLGACVIGLALAEPGARIASRYAVNLVGTGLGALGVVLLMHVADLATLLWTLTGIAAAAAALFACAQKNRAVVLGVILGVVGLSISWSVTDLEVTVSQYKKLGLIRDLEAQGDAERIAERWGPLGWIEVIASDSLHAAPADAALDAERVLPLQRLIVVDGDDTMTVNRFDGDLSRFAYLDRTTSALAYRLLEKPVVALVGAGGGEQVLLAKRHDARRVTATQLDANVIELMRGPLREFSGNVYDLPDVRIVCSEGRAFFETTDERFDLIMLPIVESFNPAAAGAHALSEHYAYTAEAFTTYFNRLTDDGILSITCGLSRRQIPFEDKGGTRTHQAGTIGVKLFATVARAWEAIGWDPAPHVVAVRTAWAMTVLVKRSAFTPEEQNRVRAFADERGFDLVVLPDMKRTEANRNAVLSSGAIYHDAARHLLGRRADSVSFGDSLDIRPTTDSRPYFFDFFRWKLLGPFLDSPEGDRALLVDWGYVALIATLLQAGALSVVLILVPLFFVRRKKRDVSTPRGPHAAAVLGYFLCLGLAFMFLEMTYIQRMIRFLWHPVYSVAVVLTGFLVFAGVGSTASGKIRGRDRSKIVLAVIGICAVAVLEHFLLPPIFSGVRRASFVVRACVALAAIAPLAFCMGVPFPTGL